MKHILLMFYFQNLNLNINGMFMFCSSFILLLEKFNNDPGCVLFGFYFCYSNIKSI